MKPDLDIAVLIPCYNEALTIVKVVKDFQTQLPDARIYVFDNNSSDGSDNLARAAGAIVIPEKRQGKGYVIASMFNKIDADYYLMVDGDDTYPAERARDLLQPLLEEKADMVAGYRLSEYEDKAFRPMHIAGNKLVCSLINLVFHSHLIDPMTGYRAFTREVAENLPIVASGFDVETEMTLQLLYRHFVIKELPIAYRARPVGSISKLRTYSDGFKVLMKILGIIEAYKPLTFFGSLAIVSFMVGAIGAVTVVVQYLNLHNFSILFGLLAVGGTLLSTTFLSVGLILHTMNFRILEMTNISSRQITRLSQNKSK
jgi:glycosyltransferase involved in cell wall biosynthesis